MLTVAPRESHAGILPPGGTSDLPPHHPIEPATVPASPTFQPDTLELSDAAKKILEKESDEKSTSSDDAEESKSSEKAKKEQKSGDSELTDEQKEHVKELQQIDREVRAHEAAHVAAGGQHVVGGISYEFETGPDGNNYAVAGEVRIDSSPAATPQETIQKAQQVRAAALAPADPSPADMQVAARASQMLMEANRELAQERMEENQGKDKEAESGTAESYNRSGLSSFDRPLGSALDIYS